METVGLETPGSPASQDLVDSLECKERRVTLDFLGLAASLGKAVLLGKTGQ